MNIESYAKQPLDVEVFPIGEYTDIILRRNIKEIMSEATEGQEAQTIWRCEEVQRRVSGAVTLEQAREQFDALWDGTAQADSVEARVAELEAAIDLLLSGATV